MNQSPFFADVPFRAKRDYVHSTSLCNALSDRFPGFSRLELVLKHWMDSRVLFTPVDAVRPGEGTGYLKIRHGDRDDLFELSQDSAYPVTDREPYDEDALVDADAVNVAERHLTCLPGAGGSFYDRMIAANKVLITRCLNPGVRLVASKVVVHDDPDALSAFTLQLTSHAGTRIFKSRLLIEDQPMGELIFYGQ